jgi:hypothetical protein
MITSRNLLLIPLKILPIPKSLIHNYMLIMTISQKSAKHQLIEDTNLEMRFGKILCGMKKEGWQPSEPPPHIWIDQGVVLEELLGDESEEELLSFLLFLSGLDSDFSESVIPLFFPA